MKRRGNRRTGVTIAKLLRREQILAGQAAVGHTVVRVALWREAPVSSLSAEDICPEQPWLVEHLRPLLAQLRKMNRLAGDLPTLAPAVAPGAREEETLPPRTEGDSPTTRPPSAAEAQGGTQQGAGAWLRDRTRAGPQAGRHSGRADLPAPGAALLGRYRESRRYALPVPPAASVEAREDEPPGSLPSAQPGRGQHPGTEPHTTSVQARRASGKPLPGLRSRRQHGLMGKKGVEQENATMVLRRRLAPLAKLVRTATTSSSSKDRATRPDGRAAPAFPTSHRMALCCP